jgi:hypothetical protein
MNVYRILFKNEDIFCCHAISNNNAADYSTLYCEFENGKPTYALIKAGTEKEAYTTAQGILSNLAAEYVTAA